MGHKRLPHREHFQRRCDEHEGEAGLDQIRVIEALLFLDERIEDLRCLVLESIGVRKPRIVTLIFRTEGPFMADKPINYVLKALWSDGFEGFNSTAHQQPADWTPLFTAVTDSGDPDSGGSANITGVDTVTFEPGTPGSSGHLHAVYNTTGTDGKALELTADTDPLTWAAAPPTIAGIKFEAA